MGVKLGRSHWGWNVGYRVFENRVFRRIFRPKKDEATSGENYIMRWQVPAVGERSPHGPTSWQRQWYGGPWQQWLPTKEPCCAGRYSTVHRLQHNSSPLAGLTVRRSHPKASHTWFNSTERLSLSKTPSATHIQTSVQGMVMINAAKPVHMHCNRH
jgi:hypothetical protein